MIYAMHYSSYHQKVRQERDRERERLRERERKGERDLLCSCFFPWTFIPGHGPSRHKFIKIKIKIKQKCLFEIEVDSLHKLCTHTHTQHQQQQQSYPLQSYPFVHFCLAQLQDLQKIWRSEKRDSIFDNAMFSTHSKCESQQTLFFFLSGLIDVFVSVVDVLT